MTATLKYNLQEIIDLSYSGFTFKIPDDVVSIINYLCSNVGSPGLNSNIFQKSASDRAEDTSASFDGFKTFNKKRKNKSMEVSNDEWETLRSFQATKIEQKTGIDGDIDQIRLFLNKLTDKTFLDMREKIIEKIDRICLDTKNESDIIKLGNVIYDLSSTNKFYSRIFADLFAELLNLYSWLKPIFDEKYKNIMLQYNNIVYVDPEKDYDKFCDMNKNNERRKAITTFIVNLALCGVIPRQNIVIILKDLLETVVSMIDKVDKKNEVDELTENIAILFNKDIIDSVINSEDYDEDEYLVDDKTIFDTITTLAKSKAKDYPSLSNKAIFKFMDLVEM
jgi:hypothetical protein